MILFALRDGHHISESCRLRDAMRCEPLRGANSRKGEIAKLLESYTL